MAGSWIISTVTNLYPSACVCMCVCVPPSVHCPCFVLGCCRVPRLLCILPPVRRFACAATVCAGLQFTQIWPYCRQVSLLWEVLQRDPGQQCDPGGRPGTATDVSYQARVARKPADDHLARLLGSFLSGLDSLERVFDHMSQHELCCCFLSLFCAVWSQKSSLKRRKMICWTLNRKYCLDSNISVTLIYVCAVMVFTTFCKESTEKANVCLCRFVECKDCGRKMHQICVLHYDVIWPSG